MAPALRMTRSIKEKLPIFFFSFFFWYLVYIVSLLSIYLLSLTYFLCLSTAVFLGLKCCAEFLLCAVERGLWGAGGRRGLGICLRWTNERVVQVVGKAQLESNMRTLTDCFFIYWVSCYCNSVDVTHK